MVKNKMLRVDTDIWDKFREIAIEEGIFLGKMLEILIQNYKQKAKLNHPR